MIFLLKVGSEDFGHCIEKIADGDGIEEGEFRGIKSQKASMMEEGSRK